FQPALDALGLVAVEGQALDERPDEGPFLLVHPEVSPDERAHELHQLESLLSAELPRHGGMVPGRTPELLFGFTFFVSRGLMFTAAMNLVRQRGRGSGTKDAS